MFSRTSRHASKHLKLQSLLNKCRSSPSCIGQEALFLFRSQIIVTITFNGIITNFVFFIHGDHKGQASIFCQRRRILLEPDRVLHTTMDFSVAKGVLLSNGDCEITGKQIVSTRHANPLCTRMIDMRWEKSMCICILLERRCLHSGRQRHLLLCQKARRRRRD